MDSMQCELVTPEATAFSGPATQIDIPGALGDFGVLPGHMPLISTLRPGVIRIHTDKGTTKRVFVGGGVAKIKSESCTIVTERMTDLENFSRSDAEKSLSEAKTALENSLDESEKIELIKEVNSAQALVSALS